MKKENFDFIKTVIVVVICITTIISYQTLVSIPKHKIEAQKEKENSIKIKYQSCVTNAYVMYSKNWNLACSDRSLEDDCNLPRIVANAFESDLEKKKTDICKVEAEMGL
jgi:hypothetical protein